MIDASIVDKDIDGGREVPLGRVPQVSELLLFGHVAHDEGDPLFAVLHAELLGRLLAVILENVTDSHLGPLLEKNIPIIYVNYQKNYINPFCLVLVFYRLIFTEIDKIYPVKIEKFDMLLYDILFAVTICTYLQNCLCKASTQTSSRSGDDEEFILEIKSHFFSI